MIRDKILAAMSDELHIHIHDHAPAWATDLAKQLRRIERKLTLIMADLSRITAEVEETRTVQESTIALLTNLSQQIRDLSTDPAALNALADELDASNKALADAVVANTPAVAAADEPPFD